MKTRLRIPKKLKEGGFKGEHAAAINELIEVVTAMQLVPTPDVQITTGPQGTSIKVVGGTGTGTDETNLPRWL